MSVVCCVESGPLGLDGILKMKIGPLPLLNELIQKRITINFIVRLLTTNGNALFLENWPNLVFH